MHIKFKAQAKHCKCCQDAELTYPIGWIGLYKDGRDIGVSVSVPGSPTHNYKLDSGQYEKILNTLKKNKKLISV